ncbi:hypothetical protein TNIN_12371 [Trichonephila inaurata madagascariensis]|uniref:Uncharacterized protein n=1 Tax=Trichonephila inaurata madagascariensis TaxID=2747483 RepID=A0A8X6X022_9ARAC|nr:hypothetical protein TNIN_12371 [Trichonephila inaurata madagascariensis]
MSMFCRSRRSMACLRFSQSVVGSAGLGVPHLVEVEDLLLNDFSDIFGVKSISLLINTLTQSLPLDIRSPEKGYKGLYEISQLRKKENGDCGRNTCTQLGV